MKNILIGFILGAVITLFGIDYTYTKAKIKIINKTAYRCSQALFDDNEDWNEYSLSICQDIQSLKNRVSKLERLEQ